MTIIYDSDSVPRVNKKNNYIIHIVVCSNYNQELSIQIMTEWNYINFLK